MYIYIYIYIYVYIYIHIYLGIGRVFSCILSRRVPYFDFAYLNELCHIWTSHVTQSNESRCTVASRAVALHVRTLRTWTSNVTYGKVTWHNSPSRTAQLHLAPSRCTYWLDAPECVVTHTDSPRHKHQWLIAHTGALSLHVAGYGVALASRIDKIVGLFCKRAL